MKEQDSFLSRIILDPKIRGGKPCIKNTRIAVYDILSYLTAGVTINEILDDFPYINNDDILACFAYCLDLLNNK